MTLRGPDQGCDKRKRSLLLTDCRANCRIAILWMRASISHTDLSQPSIVHGTARYPGGALPNAPAVATLRLGMCARAIVCARLLLDLWTLFEPLQTPGYSPTRGLVAAASRDIKRETFAQESKKR